MTIKRWIVTISVLLSLFFPCTLQAKEVISILYFDNTTQNAEYDWLRKGLADMLITDVAKSDQFQVVERELLEKILKEQELSQTGLIEEAQAVQVGKLLNASRLIYGSYIIMGENLRVDTRITEVETGTIVDSVEVSGKLQDLFVLEKDLAAKIFNAFDVQSPAELESQETDSVDAVRSYYEGLTLLDQGDTDQAIEKFEQASELDPLYMKPLQRLEDAYKFLKNFRKLRKQRELRELFQKANQLRKRLQSKEWQTYAELIQSSDFMQKTPEEQKKFNEDHAVYTICETRAACTWHLMMTLMEIGQKYETDFNEPEKKRWILTRIFQIGEKAAKLLQDDPFTAEVRYFQIHALRGLGDYERLKTYTEAFLLKYPDYRLIEFVEDFYEEALEHLK